MSDRTACSVVCRRYRHTEFAHAGPKWSLQSSIFRVFFRQSNRGRTAGFPLYGFFWVNDGNSRRAFDGFRGFREFLRKGMWWDGRVFPQTMTDVNLFDLGDGLAGIFYRKKDSRDALCYRSKGLVEMDRQPRTLCAAQIRFSDGGLP